MLMFDEIIIFLLQSSHFFIYESCIFLSIYKKSMNMYLKNLTLIPLDAVIYFFVSNWLFFKKLIANNYVLSDLRCGFIIGYAANATWTREAPALILWFNNPVRGKRNPPQYARPIYDEQHVYLGVGLLRSSPAGEAPTPKEALLSLMISSTQPSPRWWWRRYL